MMRVFISITLHQLATSWSFCPDNTSGFEPTEISLLKLSPKKVLFIFCSLTIPSEKDQIAGAMKIFIDLF